MYLCHQLTDLDGRTHPMVGLFPFSTKMSSRLTALGYREVTALAGNPLFADGVKFRGHLFHHSQLVGAPEKTAEVYTAVTARGTSSDSESFGSDRVLAGYLHLHFLSNPDALADAFRRIAAESPL
jgi:cobyrinic acid a,c-diamide synthase